MDRRVLSMAYSEQAVKMFVELANVMMDPELLAMPPRVVGKHGDRSLVEQIYGHQPMDGGIPVLYALADDGHVEIWNPEEDNNAVGYYDILAEHTRDDATLDGDALADELFNYPSSAVVPLGTIVNYLRGEMSR